MTGQKGGFNPLVWVEHPIECAFVWAFEPPQDSFQNNINGMEGAWAASAPGAVIAAIPAAFQGIPAANGCKGPPFVFHAFTLNVVGYPMDACSDPMSSVAATVHAGLAAVVVMLSFFSIVRYATAIFGFVGFGNTRSELSVGSTYERMDAE
jgi:hypothetical protein